VCLDSIDPKLASHARQMPCGPNAHLATAGPRSYDEVIACLLKWSTISPSRVPGCDVSDSLRRPRDLAAELRCSKPSTAESHPL
jgi:hypothetical protein